MKYNFMKKIKAILPIAVLSLALVTGCGDNSGSSSKKDSNKESASEENAGDNANETENANGNNERLDEAKAGMENRPLVVAHRGYCSIAPDNSMSSFQAASDLGADMIELDVQMTSDGYIVVYHDLDTEKLTGEKKRISDYTYEELRQHSIGSEFDLKTGMCDGMPEYTGYAGERIPTFNEVMRFARDNDMKVFIEIKSVTDVTDYSDEEIRYFLNKIVDIVEENDMIDNVVLASFNYDYLCIIDERNHDYSICFLTNILDIEVLETNEVIDSVSLAYQCVQADTVERLHSKNKEVYVWTVDNLEMFKFFTSMGVDGIVTNNVGLCDYYK